MAKNRDSAAAAQRARILEALRRRPRSSVELRRMGIYQHSTRIFELRKLGYDIRTERISVVDDAGFPHDGIALYTLHGGDDE